jgi:hypothetical protein
VLAPLRGLLIALVLASCAGDGAEPPLAPPPPDALDQCGGACSNVELCAPDSNGVFACARICANQFHCWSGCCLRNGTSGYNVCRATEECFAPQ